mmetsp:Transcript_149379/g.479738  ORF Transcript_149379/g.479738 Transcript_149379/m.479738 type:complete len:203 (+) Transcript_149379:797-1405(+)
MPHQSRRGWRCLQICRTAVQHGPRPSGQAALADGPQRRGALLAGCSARAGLPGGPALGRCQPHRRHRLQRRRHAHGIPGGRGRARAGGGHRVLLLHPQPGAGKRHLQLRCRADHLGSSPLGPRQAGPLGRACAPANGGASDLPRLLPDLRWPGGLARGHSLLRGARPQRIGRVRHRCQRDRRLPWRDRHGLGHRLFHLRGLP